MNEQVQLLWFASHGKSGDTSIALSVIIGHYSKAITQSVMVVIISMMDGNLSVFFFISNRIK